MAISRVTTNGMYTEAFIFKLHLKTNTLLIPERKLYTLTLF